MAKALKNLTLGILPVPANKLEWGQRLAEFREANSEASFARLIREVLSRGTSTATVHRWMRRARALADAVPYRIARKALSEVTAGDGLFSVAGGDTRLSDGYAEGLRRFPIPAEESSYEDFVNWAREVSVVAAHHVDLNVAQESWQVQTAKARFSEVFRRARTEGPQRITKQGKEGVVMVAEEQYERLVGKARQPVNIVDFFRQSPLMGLDLDLARDRSPARDLDL